MAKAGINGFASFLERTEIIDWDHPQVLAQAKAIARSKDSAIEIAKGFEWVRDNIQHSADFQRGPVTCTASEVLSGGTGYCYAKSHLLAALLRANNIPAGFCYQRLAANDEGSSFCLHGFNAIHLDEAGWYRVDARGNKPGVDAQFRPPLEQLAFTVSLPEERDFPEIHAAPLQAVISALRKHHTWDGLLKDLPDWQSPSLFSRRLSML